MYKKHQTHAEYLNVFLLYIEGLSVIQIDVSDHFRSYFCHTFNTTTSSNQDSLTNRQQTDMTKNSDNYIF